MNKTTRVIEDSEYCVVIETIRNGFEYMGVSHKPNPRIAMVLQLERNSLESCDNNYLSLLQLMSYSLNIDSLQTRIAIH